MPSRFAVVLQMPRGNLETIFPRALVVASIRQSIESKQYGLAFLACRNQRVDMNILHDHSPNQFLANVPLVIDQLQKVEHIDLFLSQLRYESQPLHENKAAERRLVRKMSRPLSTETHSRSVTIML